MKQLNYLFFFLVLLVACKDAKQHPKLGDYVLYDYIIKQGDSVVYDASSLRQDTAQAILENPTTNENEIQKKLMSNITELSAGDSVQFDISFLIF